MAVFQDELTVTGEALTANDGHVAEREGDGAGAAELLGYYTLMPHPGEGGVLIEFDHMFVHADHLCRGIGSLLMNHALQRSKDRGFRRMRIISDPNSTGFYEKFGARKTGDHQSSIPGRTIPILEI